MILLFLGQLNANFSCPFFMPAFMFSYFLISFTEIAFCVSPKFRADLIVCSVFSYLIMARDFSKAFYNSKEWELVRATVMMRDKYLCQHCGKPATEVHHIKHLAPANVDDPSVTLNMDNLVSLCRDCHFEEHRGEHARGRSVQESYPYTFDANGMLVRKI